MKLPLHLFLATSATTTPLSASGYIASTSPTSAARRHCPPPSSPRRHSLSTRLHYKEPADSSSGDDAAGASADDTSRVWSVLARTERWIGDTLARSNRAETARLDAAEAERRRQEQARSQPLHFADEKEAAPPPRADNPYARKEVSYACETGEELVAVVGGVFRRVREARELGEGHGRAVEARREDASQSAYTTMRQTNLVVIPNCEDISNFETFDKLIKAINQARRASRDYVLMPKEEEDDDEKDWSVSINCAHLHPDFGALGPADQLAALRREEAAGEVDVNLEAYKKNRDAARRAPYPSVIIEVRSTPPPDFGARTEADEAVARIEAAARDAMEVRGREATGADVRRLEALFGRSAATRDADDPFYDALGEAFGDKQLAPRAPLGLAQDWVLRHDPAFNAETSAFTESTTRHVDTAHEYVFHNLAMLAGDAAVGRGRKIYVVLPHFAPTSATSLDRFAGQVSNVVRAMPGLAERVVLSTFHPEHVTEGTRAPVPIVVLTWQ